MHVKDLAQQYAGKPSWILDVDTSIISNRLVPTSAIDRTARDRHGVGVTNYLQSLSMKTQ